MQVLCEAIPSREGPGVGPSTLKYLPKRAGGGSKVIINNSLKPPLLTGDAKQPAAPAQMMMKIAYRSLKKKHHL
jgi:hypothetical protein